MTQTLTYGVIGHSSNINPLEYGQVSSFFRQNGQSSIAELRIHQETLRDYHWYLHYIAK